MGDFCEKVPDCGAYGLEHMDFRSLALIEPLDIRQNVCSRELTGKPKVATGKPSRCSVLLRDKVCLVRTYTDSSQRVGTPAYDPTWNSIAAASILDDGKAHRGSSK
jgi:hypothetical protein